MSIRKRIDIRLPELLLQKADELCEKELLTRTNYIENLIRADFEERGIDFEPPKEYKLEDWWDEKDNTKRKSKTA
jgi:hypothetical protein